MLRVQQVTEGLNRPRLLLRGKAMEIQRAGRDDGAGRSASQSNETVLDGGYLFAKGLPTEQLDHLRFSRCSTRARTTRRR